MTFDLVLECDRRLWLRSAGTNDLVEAAVPDCDDLKDLSRDGGTALMTLAGFGPMVLVDLPDGEPRPVRIDSAEALVVGSFSPDGGRVALLDENAGVYLYSVDTMEHQLVWRDVSAGHSNESGIAWSPSGDILAVTIWGRDGGVVPGTLLLDASDGRELAYRELTCLSPPSSAAWTTTGELFVRDFITHETVELREGLGSSERWAPGAVLGRMSDGRRIIGRPDGSRTVLAALDRDGEKAFDVNLDVPAGLRAIRTSGLLTQ